MPHETIGWIGTGSLGLPMANNVLSAGYGLRVYNRTPERARPLIARGAQFAGSPADAVEEGGVVASLIWDDDALDAVIESDGFLEKLGKGGVHISMATVSPEASHRAAERHREFGSDYVEAPVFGRPEAAEARQLWMPVAAKPSVLERVRPLLVAMGVQGIFEFGEAPGNALLVKLVGNFLIVSAGRSLAEGLSVARSAGLDGVAVVEMLTSTLFPAPIYRSYGFAAARSAVQATSSPIPKKDLGLLSQVAKRENVEVPITDFHRGLLAAMGPQEGEA